MSESADVINLTNAHLPTGKVDAEIVLLLSSLLAKARRGDLTGMCIAWVEGQNDVVYQIEGGFARDALLVAGASGLFWEVHRRWRANG